MIRTPLTRLFASMIVLFLTAVAPAQSQSTDATHLAEIHFIDAVAEPADAAATEGPADGLVTENSNLTAEIDKSIQKALLYASDSAERKYRIDLTRHIVADRSHSMAKAYVAQCKQCHETTNGLDVLVKADPRLTQYYDLAFSLSANASWIQSIPRENLDKPWIGVSVGELSDVLRSQLHLPADHGVVIANVIDASPAAAAGVQQHDILLTISDQPITAGEDLDRIVKAHSMDDPPLSLVLVRGGKKMTIEVTPRTPLDLRLEAILPPGVFMRYRIGVVLEDPDDTLRTQLGLEAEVGVIITSVIKESAAEKAGVLTNDVITAVNGEPVKGSADLAERVRSSEGKPLKLELRRGGASVQLQVTPQKEIDREMRRRVYLDILGLLPPSEPREVEILGAGAVSGDKAEFLYVDQPKFQQVWRNVIFPTDAETQLRNTANPANGNSTASLPLLIDYDRNVTARLAPPQPSVEQRLDAISNQLQKLQESIATLNAQMQLEKATRQLEKSAHPVPKK